MKTTRACTLCCAALGLSWGVWAADARDYDAYIKLVPATTECVGGYPAAEKWDPAGEMTSSGYYLVPAGKTLVSNTRSDASGLTWPMAELAIAGTFTATATGARTYAATTGRLALLPGGKLLIKSAYGTVKGDTLDIRGTAADPAVIDYTYSSASDNNNYYAKLDIVLTGDADAVVTFVRTASGGSDFQRAYRVKGFDGYLGSVVVDGSHAWLRPDATTTAFDIGGRLCVTNGASVLVDAVSPTFGSLALSSDATLRIASGKTVTVTNSFSIAAGAKIVYDKAADFNSDQDTAAVSAPLAFTVLSVCGAAPAAAVDRAALLQALRAGSESLLRKGGIPRLKLVESSRTDGGVDFKLSHEPFVLQTKAPASGTGPYGYGQYAEYLSDGQPISADKDYYVNLSAVYFNSPYVFPGRSLTINLGAGNRNIGFYGGNDITIPDLRVFGENSTSRFRMMTKNGSAWLRGSFTLWGFVPFRLSGSGVFRVAASLHGDGDVCEVLDVGKVNEGSACRALLSLEGDNSDWSGRALVGWGRAATDEEALTNLTLRVSSGPSLGGAIGAFTFDAVKIAGTCTLDITNTATFAAANRGWCLLDGASVSVAAGRTATVNETVTFGGAVEKRGAGTLVLGGAAKFYDAADDAATDTPNGASLRIAAGGLGVVSADALAGVDVAFADGTKLLVFPGAGCLTLPSAPTLEGGALPVEIEIAEGAHTGTADILSLPASVPFDAGALAVARRKGYRIGAVATRADGANTVYFATFSKNGFTLVFR